MPTSIKIYLFFVIVSAPFVGHAVHEMAMLLLSRGAY